MKFCIVGFLLSFISNDVSLMMSLIRKLWINFCLNFWKWQLLRQ